MHHMHLHPTGHPAASCRRGRVAALLGLLVLLVLLVLPRPSAAGDDLFMAQLVARSFFRGIIEGEVGAVMPLCASQFNFDGEAVTDRQQVRQRLGQANMRARERGLQLRRVVVLPLREAVQRYGEPPERLRKVVRRGHFVALARFNVLGAVAILERQGPFWKVVALTD